jgi:hypothetical protein
MVPAVLLGAAALLYLLLLFTAEWSHAAALMWP